jgi:putative ATP-dependent endonuclease of the OLD family
MRIAQIEISGFRGINSGCVVLPQHAALLGANNVGKTAVTDALALVFGRERMAYQLSDWDFFGGAPKPDTLFTIICTVTDFPSDEPEDHTDWFGGESAAHPIWWHEDHGKATCELDRPEGGKLAAQVALSARYEDETCDFETLRYFYHGPGNPFTDGCNKVSSKLLQELGVFILPAQRQWDKLLSFGSSSFLKVLRQAAAIPGEAIERLKAELRNPATTIEEAPTLRPLLASAEAELRRFLMLSAGGSLSYRATSLDTYGVLQSLLPHIKDSSGALLPLSRQGAGMVSLQAFLIVLAFAEKRKAAGKNFILVAEEPELHLHPSLHKRLANRIRAVSAQSVITTHSPLVAASYPPTQAVFLSNDNGSLSAQPMRRESTKDIKAHPIRKLYTQKREAFYEAILGPGTLVPEGEFDYHWLRLLQQLAECSEDETGAPLTVAPVSIVPTQDSLAETYPEVARLRPDAVPVVDGDDGGDGYLVSLAKCKTPPTLCIQLGPGAAVECLAAWVLQPALASPGPHLSKLLGDPSGRHLRALQVALHESSAKKARELHECLAWEALETPACGTRAAELFNDFAAIIHGENPKNAGWQQSAHASGIPVWVAEHITKEQACPSPSSSLVKQVPVKQGS